MFLTQGFGANPASYARFGLKGHNGWDYRTKVLEDIVLANGRTIPATPTGKRPLLSPWFSQLYKKGFDPAGYGKFFEVIVKLYSTWKLTYGHCSSIGDWEVRHEAQDMALSGSTGNSTADHVHETVKRITIVNGEHRVHDYNNGYFGAVNNQEFYDELRKWKKEMGGYPEIQIPEGGDMEQYKGYNLEDKASMRVAVDTLVEVQNGVFIRKADAEKATEDLKRQFEEEKKRAVDDAFRRGVEIGKAEPRVPSDEGQPAANDDLSGWEQDGLIVETTEGNKKVIRNYRKKS